MSLRIGIDIGGTKTQVVALGADGTVTAEHRLATGFGADAVLDAAESAVRALAADLGIAPADFATIGVGIPGAVDPASGRVTHALNLGLEDLDLGGELGARLGRPVRVENDVNAAALGAWQALGGGATESMAYLNLGTGLAAGLVLHGRLWRGARGVAGEIGHIPVDPAGALCPCGQRGCLELTASGSGLARVWDGDSIRGLHDAATGGDAAALGVWNGFVDHVAASVRLLVLTVDPDRVVIGGGLSSLGDELLGAVRGVLGDWAASSPFLAMLDLPSRVEVLPRDFPAAAVGAALVGAAAGED
ncbi:ROK family protein [Pseudolysinimonas sp.]